MTQDPFGIPSIGTPPPTPSPNILPPQGLPVVIPPAPPPLPTTPAAPAPNAPAARQGPVPQVIPTVVPRKPVTATPNPVSLSSQRMQLKTGDSDTYESNLLSLINKSLEAAQHDRELAIALLQVYLDRAEVLDGMALSMPVATVISDNTGAILKSLELTQHAGERLLDLAKLLVDAKKADDTAVIKMFAAKLAEMKLAGGGSDGNGWGDLDQIGGAKSPTGT